MNTPCKSGFGECLKNRVWRSRSCLGKAGSRGSWHQNTLKRGHQAAARDHTGFTLVELLVAIGTVGLLTLMLIPALAGTRPNSRAFQCENNTRQLILAWLMYSADNGDKLMSSTAWIPSSPFMDWSYSSANTNTARLLDPSQSLIANYIRSATVFKCPADTYPAANGPRVRSYSISASVGGTANNKNQDGKQHFNARKNSDLNTPGPAKIWVFVDEHPDSIDDGSFHLDPGQRQGSIYWRNMPASFHDGSYGASFTDGHSEIVRLVERGGSPGGRTSLLPVVPDQRYAFYNNYNSSPMFSGGHYIVMYSGDYARMSDGTPYR